MDEDKKLLAEAVGALEAWKEYYPDNDDGTCGHCGYPIEGKDRDSSCGCPMEYARPILRAALAGSGSPQQGEVGQ